MSELSLVNLLIVDRSQAAVDQLVELLRTAGYLVQAMRAEQQAEIHDFIQYRPIDLILVRHAEGLPTLAELRAEINAAAQDIPILAIVDELLTQTPLELLRDGADNCCQLADPGYLLMIIAKELRQLRIRQTARSQAIKLKESEARCLALLESSPDAIAYIHEGAHSYANPAYLKLFGYANEQELAGTTLINLVSPDDRDKLKSFLRQSTKAGRSTAPTNVLAVDREGQQFPVQMDCVLTRMDEEPCLQIRIQHPARLASNEQKLEKVGERDELTGFYSRKFFTHYLNQICTGEQSGAVLYILLTDYRSVSENLGLEAVDQLVVDLTKLLNSMVSANEIVARFSDAVFVIYTSESSPKLSLQMGERVCHAVKSHVTHTLHKTINTTCSIGICMVQKNHENAMQILSQVDRVCEIARQMGDNQVQIYPPLVNQTSEPEQQEGISTLIRDAMSTERISLLFQPIASFQDSTDERYKAYLRMLGEDKKPLPVGTFGAVAESRGLMRPLDRWIISRGLQIVSERVQKLTKPVTLFIRISQNSVVEGDFHDWLERRLKDIGLTGNSLVIEVAEQCAEKHFFETKQLREHLQRLGCGFALSHCSGRPNSLRLLKHLGPDYIKLDGSLIEKLAKGKDKESSKIMASLTEEAQLKKILVVAADVSTAPQMASIWQFGVALVQGDMVQEPSPEMGFDFQQFAG